MNRIRNAARWWGLAAAVAVGALSLTSVAQAATEAGAGETSAVTRGDLTETLTWTGELAYANQASLTYQGGQSDAGGPGGLGGSAGTLASTSAASKVGSLVLPTVAVGADATPTPSPTASPSPSPEPSPEPSPSPTQTPTPEPGGGTTCPCTGQTPTGQAPTGQVPSGMAPTTAGSGTASAATGASAKTGLVTWLPAAGSLVSNGGALYRVDDAPVVLLEGTATLYRDLAAGDSGDDVLALETALTALGYGPTMTVDGDFTSATAGALEDFQEAVGIEPTGELDLTTVVMHDGPVVVSTLVAAVGDEATAGTEMLVMADPARDVAFSLDPAQLTSVAPGDVVSTTLADGASAEATITSIAAAPSDDGTFLVTASLDPAAAVTGDHFEVKVSLQRALATDALLIDPYSLVLLEGNRTVVRVQRDGSTVDVEVTVIATAGRSTAVDSDDLREGDIIES